MKAPHWLFRLWVRFVETPLFYMARVRLEKGDRIEFVVDDRLEKGTIVNVLYTMPGKSHVWGYQVEPDERAGYLRGYYGIKAVPVEMIVDLWSADDVVAEEQRVEVGCPVTPLGRS